MIYEYKDLKGVIKVGDRVRAVPGKTNGCNYELNNDGSNEQKITAVDDEYFYINGCVHQYLEGIYLDLIQVPKTLDDLQVGDEVVASHGRTCKVLARLENVVWISEYNDGLVHWDTTYSHGMTIEHMKRNGYTLPQPPEPTKVELTVGELEEKLQMPSGTLRIKKE